MRNLSLEEMETLEAGECNLTLAGIAVVAGAASIVFPPAAYLGWAAVGAWMSQCIT